MFCNMLCNVYDYLVYIYCIFDFNFKSNGGKNQTVRKTESEI